MNKEKFQNAINSLFPIEPNDNVIEGLIFLLLKDGSLTLLNLNNEDNTAIIGEFANALKAKCLTGDYELKKYSKADTRNDCFYVYDLPDLPESFEIMAIPRAEHEDIPNFNAAEHRLNEVCGIMIHLSKGGKDIVLFKNVYAIEIIGVQSKILLYKQNERFERAKNDMIRLTPDFDVILVDGKYIITNLKNTERIQQLTQITINIAAKHIDDLDNKQIIYNIDNIREMVKDDLSLAKKVIKIVSDSMVISKKVSNDLIIKFAKKKEAKFGKITYSEDGTQFNPTNKKEFKQLLSILNDDILTSELTNEDYSSVAKDHLK